MFLLAGAGTHLSGAGALWEGAGAGAKLLMELSALCTALCIAIRGL